jgi:hypothetical protein
MDRERVRPEWVWAALVLQCVVLLIGVWSASQMIFLWPKYPAYAGRSIVEAILLAISLIGLWKSKRWGWLLAVLVDAAICLLCLRPMIQFPRLILNVRLWAFNIWEFAAFVVLIHAPVREFFRSDSKLLLSAAAPRRMPETEGHALGRPFRVLVYFVAIIVATCFVTALALALWLGEKAGGDSGFLFLLLIGFEIGSFASFLFGLILTLLARRFGPARLGMWLTAGVLLAPGLVLALGRLAMLVANATLATGPLGVPLYVLLSGPMYLFQVWWLSLPAGIVTSFLCCQIYPWAFGRSK